MELIRAAYGAAQLLAPAASARVIGARTDRLSLRACRVLGARHVTQALVLRHRSAAAHRLGAAVDLAHAGSMFAWAALDPWRRGDAVLNGMTAVAFAVAETRGSASRRSGMPTDRK